MPLHRRGASERKKGPNEAACRAFVALRVSFLVLSRKSGWIRSRGRQAYKKSGWASIEAYPDFLLSISNRS